MGTSRAPLFLLAISTSSFLCASFAQRLEAAQAAPLIPGFASEFQISPDRLPGNFPGDIQAFQFPGSTNLDNTICFKKSAVGSCIEASRCRSSDDTGSGRCRTGQLCCEFKDMKPAIELDQLVTDCGRPKPIQIFFPDRTTIDRGFAFTRLSNERTPGGGLLTIRERRSANRFAGFQEVQLATERPPVDPVVGGTDVPVSASLPVGRWPWIALLGFTEGGTLKWKCGGTLISNTVVLTAAHCVSSRQPGDLTVRLGEYKIGTSLDGRHTDVSVSRIISHPDYRASQNDIALLMLSKPATFSERIRPACLPPKDADHTGETVSLAGWGRIKFDGDTADTLQEVDLVVVKETDCEMSYRRSNSFERTFPGGFQGTKICANGADGTSRDACQGDSGGPLVVKGDDERYQVIGVVSTGLGCGSPQYPGIYTKVSKYIPWILSNS